MWRVGAVELFQEHEEQTRDAKSWRNSTPRQTPQVQFRKFAHTGNNYITSSKRADV